MSVPNYNRVIRKITTSFGDIFNQITLVRYNLDLTEEERFLVPIEYAAKELYVKRLQGDPNLDKKVQITLPRMSFEMTGFSYDESRKLNTNIKNFAKTSTGVVSQYNPVPYDFDFSLSIYVRNIEDGNQIIEHILPYFAPDYTIKVNLIPEMGIIKEIPIILKDTSYEVDSDGDRDSDTRMIIWTLNFKVKGFIFGSYSSSGLITNSITNILNMSTGNNNINFIMVPGGIGTYQVGELAYQGYSSNMASATGVVVSFTNNHLVLNNVVGNFISNQPIKGQKSGANYTFSSFQVTPAQYAQIIVTPSPTDANANTLYTSTAQVYEPPNINTTISPPINFDGDMLNQFGVDNLATEQENITDLM
jgi:hypothetical protein